VIDTCMHACAGVALRSCFRLWLPGMRLRPLLAHTAGSCASASYLEEALASGANGHVHALAAAHAGSARTWVAAELQQGCG